MKQSNLRHTEDCARRVGKQNEAAHVMYPPIHIFAGYLELSGQCDTTSYADVPNSSIGLGGKMSPSRGIAMSVVTKIN